MAGSVGNKRTSVQETMRSIDTRTVRGPRLWDLLGKACGQSVKQRRLGNNMLKVCHHAIFTVRQSWAFLNGRARSRNGTNVNGNGRCTKCSGPRPMGLYLRCLHEEGKVKLDTGHAVRTTTFSSEGFFADRFNIYKLCTRKGGVKVKFAHPPPRCKSKSLQTQTLQSRRKEVTRREQPAFCLEDAEQEPHPTGLVIHCPWCDFALCTNNLSPISENKSNLQIY